MDPFASITASTLAGCAISYIGLRAIGAYISPSHRGRWELGEGDLPLPQDMPPRHPKGPVDTSLIDEWNSIDLPEWNGMKDIRVTRHLLSRAYSKKDLGDLNTYIRTLKKEGRCGSKHPLNPRGDYDFDLVPLVTLLCLFGDDPNVLYPETLDHLLQELLMPERGSPRRYVPRSLGLLKETENHILMTEGSYYLVSRWMDAHGRGTAPGKKGTIELECFVRAYLEDIISRGLYEYNSDPYSSYAIHALLNLESFGSERIASLARTILDRISLFYHLGSLGHRRFPPFRRRSDRAGRGSLTCDGAIPYMRVWTEGPGSKERSKGSGSRHAIIGSLMPYRPPDWSMTYDTNHSETCTAMIGHGPVSSPEIYSRGKGFLITAGGVYRGKVSRTVSRPTTLILDDDVSSLSGTLHLGSLEGCRDHNNTGVFRNMAVSSAPVHVPGNWKGERKGPWTVYNVAGKIVMVHKNMDLSLFCVLPDVNEENRITGLNDDPKCLLERFVWSKERSVTYDIRSKKDQWVIMTVDGSPIDRDLDSWPHLRMFMYMG